jgi:hypothetical protein
MRIKSYNEFTNEEINLKKAIAGDAEREAIKSGNYNFSPIPNYKPIKRK